MHYTQKTFIKAQHKNQLKGKFQQVYELNSENIAIFPTKSYFYGEQYHLKLIQRCYNQKLN